MKYEKCIIGIFAMVFLLGAVMMVGTAKQENIRAGPYNVSFNLSTGDPYSIIIYQPVVKESYSGVSYTEYNIGINDTAAQKPGLNINKFVLIDIAHYQGQTGFNAGAISRSFEPYKTFVTLYNRTIDGKEGLLEVISVLAFNKFDFLYPVDSQTVVDVTSSFPWDDGTMNLVNTFHVEEAR